MGNFVTHDDHNFGYFHQDGCDKPEHWRTSRATKLGKKIEKIVLIRPRNTQNTRNFHILILHSV
jgi:hypothetical protein